MGGFTLYGFFCNLFFGFCHFFLVLCFRVWMIAQYFRSPLLLSLAGNSHLQLIFWIFGLILKAFEAYSPFRKLDFMRIANFRYVYVEKRFFCISLDFETFLESYSITWHFVFAHSLCKYSVLRRALKILDYIVTDQRLNKNNFVFCVQYLCTEFSCNLIEKIWSNDFLEKPFSLCSLVWKILWPKRFFFRNRA